jgi:hypothetical protein
MSRTLVLELTDDEYARLCRVAEAMGLTPAEAARQQVRQTTLVSSETDPPAALLRQDVEAAIRDTAEPIAAETGRQPDAVLAEIAANLRPAVRPPLDSDTRLAALERLRRHRGAVHSGSLAGAGNTQIDADLADEYSGRNDEAV